MSLERYCSNKRLIVQNSGVSAHEAARALENNHVGAIIVQDGGNVIGIVTDRDLTLRVIGRELDPKQTRLRDVMTPGPVRLSPEDSEQQAVALMRGRHVRRIPIVADGRAVGIVTLDDLILAEAVDLRAAASIIEAELVEPTAAKPAGVVHPLRAPPLSPDFDDPRRAARAEQTLHEFTARLQQYLGIENPEQALAAFEVVAQALVHRLTPDEAADFVSQLPSRVREKLLLLPAGPDRSITMESLERRMAGKLELDPEGARNLVQQVVASLPNFVSSGELEHVVSQLPKEMKSMFAG